MYIYIYIYIYPYIYIYILKRTMTNSWMGDWSPSAMRRTAHVARPNFGRL